MRKSVKLLANFLGATKELTQEYVDLAEITDDEQNQIAHEVRKRVVRADLPTVVRHLYNKGLSQREIAVHTGWTHGTIGGIIRKLEKVDNLSKKVDNLSKGSSRPSKTGGRKESRAAVAAESVAEGVTDEPRTKYRVVYADPPWDYGAHAQPDYQTEQRDHYAVMPVEDICALPVEDWVEDNAVLFLWVTSPILEKAFAVIRAWGFEYKASFVWDKIKHNMGHYNSVRHEFLLVCTRGACQPDKQQLFDSVQSIERGKHSSKPVEFYDIIETIYTHGRRLEMFARDRRDGWDVYGHVAEMPEAAE
jgi:N6-adenosine-specific RNA methylase IME4